MKALTLNVHAWMEENPLEKLEQLADSIEEADYDFIALQEVNQLMNEEIISHEKFIKPNAEKNSIPIKKGNYAHLLVETLRKRGKNYYWSWASNHIGYFKFDEGLAFLSKTPFTAETTIVSKAKKYSNILTRNILKIKTEIDGMTWTLLNGHFSWWKKSPHKQKLFKNEWDNTLKQIENDEKEYLLVMGDFNNEASVRNEGYQYVLGTTPFLSDSYTSADNISGEFTVPGEIDGWKKDKEGKRIDYIFTGENIYVKNHSVVFDGRETPIVSDHFGVEVKIQVN